jgi:hypothetical protein
MGISKKIWKVVVNVFVQYLERGDSAEWQRIFFI